MNNVIGYDELNEGKKDLLLRVAKDFGFNLSFIFTFSVCISAYYPIIENLMKTHGVDLSLVTPQTIILLSIASFATVFKNVNNEEAMDYFKKNNLRDVFNDIVKNLNSFKNIYDYLLDKAKGAFEFLSDALSYTLLLVPFMTILSSLITSNTLSTNDLIGCGICVGAGTLNITAKNVIKIIWKKFKKYILRQTENNNKNMEIMDFENFALNEAKRNMKKSNLSELEYVAGGVKYKNEMFPGVNAPKQYIGKGKYKYRVLAKEGNRVKPINFGDKTRNVQRISRLKKKYWDLMPNWQ